MAVNVPYSEPYHGSWYGGVAAPPIRRIQTVAPPMRSPRQPSFDPWASRYSAPPMTMQNELPLSEYTPIPTAIPPLVGPSGDSSRYSTRNVSEPWNQIIEYSDPHIAGQVPIHYQQEPSQSGYVALNPNVEYNLKLKTQLLLSGSFDLKLNHLFQGMYTHLTTLS